MAIQDRTTTADSPAVSVLLDIDRALVQAHAIVRLMGARVPDGLPPETMQNAAWAAGDLIRLANDRAATLAALAEVRRHG